MPPAEPGVAAEQAKPAPKGLGALLSGKGGSKDAPLPREWAVEGARERVALVARPPAPDAAFPVDSPEARALAATRTLLVYDGEPFAVGLDWSGPDVPVAPGRVVQVARAQAETSAAGEDLYVLATTPAGAADEDARATLAMFEGAAVAAFDQFALGRSSWHHRPGNIALARLLLARLADPSAEGVGARAQSVLGHPCRSTLFLFQLSPDPARPLWYLLGIEDGRVRPGTDRCSEDPGPLLESFQRLADGYGRGECALVADPALADHYPEAECCTLLELLAGPVPPDVRLRPFSLFADRTRLRRIAFRGVLAIAAVVAAVYGWTHFEEGRAAAERMARAAQRAAAQADQEAAELARLAREATLAVDGVRRAPWEGSQALPAPLDVAARFCTDQIHAARFERSMAASAPGGYGIYSLSGARCTPTTLATTRTALLGVGSAGEGVLEDWRAPGPPPDASRPWPGPAQSWYPRRLDADHYATVDRAGDRDRGGRRQEAAREDVSSQIEAALSPVWNTIYDHVPAYLADDPDLLLVSPPLLGSQEASRRLAWAWARAELKLPSPPPAALLDWAAEEPGLVFVSLEWSHTPAQWTLTLALAAETQVLAEVRAQERQRDRILAEEQAQRAETGEP